jgi:hypothetical protein
MEVRAHLVRVDWQVDGSNDSRTVEAVLEYISAKGACMQVEEQIPSGTVVAISVVSEDSTRLSGCVDYCIYRDYGYFVGIRFTNETVRSSPVLEPDHLANRMLSPPARR